MTDLRLSQIETLWSGVCQDHADDSKRAPTSCARLIDRYSDATQRYLMAWLRRQWAVDKVWQKLTLRFVRRGFCSVLANKGRFRTCIRTVIYHLVADFGRRNKKYAATANEHESMLARTAHQGLQLDEQFQANRQNYLLEKGWETLRKCGEATGKAWYSVVKARSEKPRLRSPELVRDLLGREVNSGNVRVLVHRARERFAEILIDLVRESLATTDQETLEHELIDRNLWQYGKCLPQPEDREGG